MTTLLAVFAVAAIGMPWIARLVGRRAFLVAALVPAAAAIWTALQAPRVLAGEQVLEQQPWIAELGIGLDFRLDGLGWSMAMLVSVVGALVLLYCAWYFTDRDEDLGRFAALLLSFAGVMFGLVTADDVIVMFIFWEATSVLSYLLIGHVTGRRESRGAAFQALLVTTFGGLAMFVGLVMLVVASGTTSLAAIVADPPALASPTTIVAIALVLLGALSKSALVPFHFWLPAAMAAPTPVSAYLHAAAMVKAGIYLFARLGPGFHEVPGWREALVVVGVTTMLVGGWRSLRQIDLKLLLAYGTVSQLGFLAIVFAFGAPNVALAGMALLIAHAAFKATLFLVVGIIDRDAGTRDIRELSGLGRSRPGLCVVAALAVASMAGVPPLFGFVAKEAVLSTLLELTGEDPGWAWAAVIGIVLGSTFTVAYSLRFLWGAFAAKSGVTTTASAPSRGGFIAAPAVLAGFGLAAALAPGLVENALLPYVDTYDGTLDYHLALWHGLEPALGLTAAAIALGLLLFAARGPVLRAQSLMPRVPDASRGYWAAIRLVDWGGITSTRLLQSRGLPGYVAIIALVFVGSAVVVTATSIDDLGSLVPFDYPMQVVVAGVAIVAAIASAVVRHRFAAVVLVGMAGYGMVVLFAMHGAPDLALTQALVETVTLVVFVLVLRRLPQRIAHRNQPRHRGIRATIGILVGLSMAVVAVQSLGSRIAEPISGEHPRMALEDGHGENVVNVLLVDIRAWDTMGEISVLVAVATGVASLLFVTGRSDAVPRLSRRGGAATRMQSAFAPATVSEPVSADGVTEIGDTSFAPAVDETRDFSAGEDAAPTRQSWLLAGRTLSAARRSILLEVLVRFLFHPAMIASVFLLFVGHNAPGGGFAGGLLAGLALVARYLAGGRYELGEAAPIDAGKLLGGGLLLAAGTAVSSMLVGKQVLESTWFEQQLGPLEISMGTSTLFDLGVYLVVVGVVLDILRSLGAQVDRHQDELAESTGGAA